MSRIALDVRRVGGLEVRLRGDLGLPLDVRRVGGLEGSSPPRLAPARDVRRVGGLEASSSIWTGSSVVVRRVGGLEGLIEESFIMGFPFLTRRRWNGRDGRSRDAPL